MARKWPPQEAMEAFVGLVNRIRIEERGGRKKATWDNVLRKVECYGVHKPRGDRAADQIKARDKLKADYSRYRNELLRRDRQRWGGDVDAWEDAEDYVDEVECYTIQNGAGKWEIDWPAAVARLHPNEPAMDVERLMARYESAVQCCRRRFGLEPASRNTGHVDDFIHYELHWSPNQGLYLTPPQKAPPGLRDVLVAVSRGRIGVANKAHR